MTLPPVLILDASVLINFLKISRIDLIQSYPAEIIITEHVRDEVTQFFPEQLAQLEKALADGVIKELIINDLIEIEEIVSFRFQKSQNRLGMGECSATIAAIRRKYSLGIDDNPAIKIILREFPQLPIVRTQDIILQLIRIEALNVAEADAIKEDWELHHRFRLTIKSFSQLL